MCKMIFQRKMAGEAARQCWREAGWAHVSFKTRLFSIQIIGPFEIEVVEYPPLPLPENQTQFLARRRAALPLPLDFGKMKRWARKNFLLFFMKGVERHLLLPREGVDLRGQWEVAQEDGTCLNIWWTKEDGHALFFWQGFCSLLIQIIQMSGIVVFNGQLGCLTKQKTAPPHNWGCLVWRYLDGEGDLTSRGDRYWHLRFENIHKGHLRTSMTMTNDNSIYRKEVAQVMQLKQNTKYSMDHTDTSYSWLLILGIELKRPWNGPCENLDPPRLLWYRGTCSIALLLLPFV